MRIFLDTNVVVDFLGKRMPFYTDAADIIDMAVRKEVAATVSSLTIINVAYILRKSFGKEVMMAKLAQLSDLCDVSAIDASIIKEAIRSNSNDFEDCVQFLSALGSKADVIITRDKTGFADLNCLAMTPADFLKYCRR